jgi:hypothetical protein
MQEDYPNRSAQTLRTARYPTLQCKIALCRATSMSLLAVNATLLTSKSAVGRHKLAVVATTTTVKDPVLPRCAIVALPLLGLNQRGSNGRHLKQRGSNGCDSGTIGRRQPP